MLASTPAPDLRDWGALSTGSIVIPGVFFWYLTRTSATLSRFSVLGGLCFVSVRTRSKLTFRHISVKYQKNARSLTIHVYMNGADGFGEHRSRPGAATRRFRRPTAPKEPPERGRRGHGTVEATDVAGAALPGRHSLTRSGGANHSPPHRPWSLRGPPLRLRFSTLPRLLEQPRGASRMHRHTVVQNAGARAAQ